MASIEVVLDYYGRHVRAVELTAESDPIEEAARLVANRPNVGNWRSWESLARELAGHVAGLKAGRRRHQEHLIREATGPDGYVRGWHCPHDHAGNTRGVLDTGAVHCAGCVYCELPSLALNRMVTS